MKIKKKNYKISNTIYIKSRALPCLNGRCIIPRCSRFPYLINIQYGHTQRWMRRSSEYSTVRWVTSATARS